MEKLHAKYVNKEDAEHKVEMFSSTLGRKLSDQLSGMETNLDTYKQGLSFKFRTKKNKPKIRFQGKADDNDLQLSTMAEKLWDDVVSKEDENTPPTGCLSKVSTLNLIFQQSFMPQREYLSKDVFVFSNFAGETGASARFSSQKQKNIKIR